MTDLRKAAEMALNYFESAYELDLHETEIRGALRKALQEDALELMVAENQRLGLYDDQRPNELLKQGWRQCAIGQRTTQYCGMAEQARLEEREVCLKEIAIELDEWGWGNNANIDLNNVAANIRARSEK